MRRVLEKTGTQKGKEIFDKAKEKFIEFEVPFIENRRLARLIKTEEPEDVFNFMFSKTGKRKGITSRAQKVFNLMDQKGREAVKSEIVNRALEDSIKEIDAREILSAAKFASNLEKSDKINKVFFNATDKSRIDGVIKLFRNTQRASQVSTSPPHWRANLYPSWNWFSDRFWRRNSVARCRWNRWSDKINVSI